MKSWAPHPTICAQHLVMFNVTLQMLAATHCSSLSLSLSDEGLGSTLYPAPPWARQAEGTRAECVLIKKPRWVATMPWLRKLLNIYQLTGWMCNTITTHPPAPPNPSPFPQISTILPSSTINTLILKLRIIQHIIFNRLCQALPMVWRKGVSVFQKVGHSFCSRRVRRSLVSSSGVKEQTGCPLITAVIGAGLRRTDGI